MLKIYTIKDGLLVTIPEESIEKNASTLAWIDMLHPTKEEEQSVESLLGIEIPTREEMHEIELSSRLYQEKGTLYTTVSLLINAGTKNPEVHAVSFILTEKTLVTLRYTELKSFDLFLARREELVTSSCKSNTLLVGLLEAVVDRKADILENLGHTLDGITRRLFQPEEQKQAKPDFQNLLKEIGFSGDSLSKASEGLITISRLAIFLMQTNHFKPDSDEIHRLKTLAKDTSALNDHTNFLSNRVNFLLDATLGMISIDQNATIKIFSVAAVVFLPPTLVASIYGMNFNTMPELRWEYGYPVALFIMVLSAYLPFRYFKKKKWL